MTVAVLNRLVLQPARESGLAVLLFQGGRHEIVVSGQTLPALGVDQSLRRRNLAIDTREPVLSTGRAIAYHVTPGPTGTQIDLAEGHRRAPWTPPLLHVFRLG